MLGFPFNHRIAPVFFQKRQQLLGFQNKIFKFSTSICIITVSHYYTNFFYFAYTSLSNLDALFFLIFIEKIQ